MRTEQEIMDLILSVAESDERIRAVILFGSRAIPDVPKDIFQDYDVCYLVTDIKPFYDNMEWVREHFGDPIMTQLPENMEGAVGDGHFTYLMIFDDGNRIDLSFYFNPYVDYGEPVLVLLDKDKDGRFIPPISPNPAYFYVKEPTAKLYDDCCNEFWWCLNNVAKGIARDELPFVMYMLNEVRSELHDMINWYIGVQHGFNLSTGKCGKYFKKFLSPDLYEKYAATYSDSNYENIWKAVDIMCELFSPLALSVAEHFGFKYHKDEEDGMREYIRMTRAVKPL